MSNIILTPVSLFKDFDDSLPLNECIVEESKYDKIKIETLYFSGRQTSVDRVRILGAFARPVDGISFPTLLIFPDKTKTIDIGLMKRFVKKGYAVFMVDYRGYSSETVADFTKYPSDIEYANTEKAERRIDYVDQTAVETSWYEWTAVGLYAIKYLKSRSDVKNIGLMGIRAGGDIVWKLMSDNDVCCGITIFASGWNAYKNINKFSDNNEIALNEERYRFLAGIDSQAYAPYVKSPMFMLCSINDENNDIDRAYDTFARINGDVGQSVIAYDTQGNGCVSKFSVGNLDMFMTKYLKGQEVFIPKPLDISIEENEENLVAKIKFDVDGEVEKAWVFMACDSMDSSIRDWQEAPFKKDVSDSEQYFDLKICDKSACVFAFAFAKYSSGFIVSSKIVCKKIEKRYKNMTPHTRIMFNSINKEDNFILATHPHKDFAECLECVNKGDICMIDGGSGVLGVYSPFGLKSYSISNPMFKPDDGSILRLDVSTRIACKLEIKVVIKNRNDKTYYTCDLDLCGGNVWQSLLVNSNDLKNDLGAHLCEFNAGSYIIFNCENKFALNNIIWL